MGHTTRAGLESKALTFMTLAETVHLQGIARWLRVHRRGVGDSAAGTPEVKRRGIGTPG
jgi:hypothetical protein